MKRSLFALFAAGSLVAAAHCASQPKTTIKQDGSATVMKQTGPGENVKTTIVTGVVTKYMPGDELEIRPADGNMHDFDLENDVQVNGAIVVGQPVTVTYVEAGGKNHVKIIAAGAMTP
ncbi:MAG TPA: hypothetical protein VIY96_01975 [Thermoanaerobaculia bacterium]